MKNRIDQSWQDAKLKIGPIFDLSAPAVQDTCRACYMAGVMGALALINGADAITRTQIVMDALSVTLHEPTTVSPES